jgi:hypothetical protein
MKLHLRFLPPRLWIARARAAVAPARAAREPEPPPALVTFDCNDNGIEDAVDIASGGSSDSNVNGVPDECEAAAAE